MPSQKKKTLTEYLKPKHKSAQYTKVKVKSDPKVPFSIATTLRHRGERYSFPWIAPLYS